VGNKRLRERPASRYDPNAVFNLGFGELLLVLIITVVIFGATKLPQIGDVLGNRNADPPRLLLRRDSRRWTRSDWALVVAAVGLVALAVANAAMHR